MCRPVVNTAHVLKSQAKSEHSILAIFVASLSVALDLKTRTNTLSVGLAAVEIQGKARLLTVPGPLGYD